MTEVSTHSRLKAAGILPTGEVLIVDVSTHSRLKAAGFADPVAEEPELVSTHSRLKAAGCGTSAITKIWRWFQHTAA